MIESRFDWFVDWLSECFRQTHTVCKYRSEIVDEVYNMIMLQLVSRNTRCVPPYLGLSWQNPTGRNPDDLMLWLVNV